ncbi:flavodoxin family protein [Fictibacillus sp. WQ 8-8]|uniref:flavodoxin family protein n=1 Tax=Fictibacillus sp. WQ 8-8 TaxID=2938788 RepID=UPI0008E85127|nr:flavodoxin family protein [Fictibacillus sp. WQ 8-8]MCQ6268058.1 flavodoxin family protein [Fictibacillus sp. WQ 8-8]SFD52149.1 Multimeric flavodoxin WrbA [Bacillus sp. OV194]
MKIAAIIGSSRTDGNTQQLTEMALEGIEYTPIILKEKQITPIDDLRHADGGFQPVADDYDRVIDMVLEHDILIFATPVYWYGMSGLMKNFVDRWSQSLRDSRFEFKRKMSQKKAYVVTCGGDQPKIKALPLIQQFQHIFDFMGMSFQEYIIGTANAPHDILKDEQAIAEAKRWNETFSSLK